MDSKLRPARVVKPGEILHEELDARGWTQKDFAEITGRPSQAISEIVHGKKLITPETAVVFSQALGTSADMWLNLESAYRLRLAEEHLRDKGVAERAARFAAGRRRSVRGTQSSADRGFHITVEPEGDEFVARCAKLGLRAVGETAHAALGNLAILMQSRLQPGKPGHASASG